MSPRRTAGVRCRPPVAVDLVIDDPDLAARIRALVLSSAELRLADPGDDATPAVRIRDAAAGDDADVALIVITDSEGATEALRAGAAAVLPPHTDGQALGCAIRAAAEGLTVVAGDFRDLLVKDTEAAVGLEAEPDTEAGSIELTPREREVLELLVEGASNKAIARRLDITPHTAKFHVAAIIAKLGAKGRTDAVARAMRLGLVMI